MSSLFPEMADELRRQDLAARRSLEQGLYRDGLKRPPCRQKVLFSGMACLAEQKDLVSTDGRMNEPEGA